MIYFHNWNICLSHKSRSDFRSVCHLALTTFHVMMIRIYWWKLKLWLIALGFSTKCRSFGFQIVSWNITVSWQILTHRRSFWIILTGSIIVSIGSVPNIWLSPIVASIKGLACMIIFADLVDGGSNGNFLFTTGWSMMIHISEDSGFQTVIPHAD